MNVTVENGAVTGIDIIEHQNGKGEKANAIVNNVVAAQNLEVDEIAGATFSSQTILKAIENALI